MAIEIVITSEGLAASMGMSVAEIERRLEAINNGVTPAPAVATTDTYDPLQPTVAPGRRYRFTAGTSKSGVCAICAQYVGMITDGSGTDGVPVPQLHNNCVCFLSPVDFDILGTNTQQGQSRRFDWLHELTWPELKDVVGDTRMKLVRQGTVAIEDLYDMEGRLIALAFLEITPSTGWMSVNQASIKTGISIAGVKDLAKRAMISGAVKAGPHDWLIPAEWGGI